MNTQDFVAHAKGTIRILEALVKQCEAGHMDCNVDPTAVAPITKYLVDTTAAFLALTTQEWVPGTP